MIQFDQYFSKGLKPPPSYSLSRNAIPALAAKVDDQLFEGFETKIFVGHNVAMVRNSWSAGVFVSIFRYTTGSLGWKKITWVFFFQAEKEYLEDHPS